MVLLNQPECENEVTMLSDAKGRCCSRSTSVEARGHFAAERSNEVRDAILTRFAADKTLFETGTEDISGGKTDKFQVDL